MSIPCYVCGAPVVEGPGYRKMMDREGEWRDLCEGCPEIPIHVILVDDRYYSNDSDIKENIGEHCTSYEERLCLCPENEFPGIWIRNKERVPKHLIGIGKALPHMTYIGANQHRQRLVWTVSPAHKDAWDHFRKTCLY